MYVWQHMATYKHEDKIEDIKNELVSYIAWIIDLFREVAIPLLHHSNSLSNKVVKSPSG